MSAITGLPQSNKSSHFTSGNATPTVSGDAARSAIVADVEALAGGPVRPSLVSVDLPLTLLPPAFRDDIAHLRSCARVLWERPDEGTFLAGFGAALSLHGERTSPISDAAAVVRQVIASAVSSVTSGARPRAFLGARFAVSGNAHDPAWDTFGGWQALFPQVLVASCDGEMTASLTLNVESGGPHDMRALVDQALTDLADPDAPGVSARLSPIPAPARPEWELSVDDALAEIDAGQYQKVVLARQAAVTLPAAIDQGAVLSRLAERYPHCFVFAFRAGGATWLGATPELLASLEGDLVHAASLAGSKPRGADAESDARLAADLIGSAKERAEHAVVALAIQEALAPVCASLTAPAAPVLLQLPNIQHLHTPVSGQLHPGHDLLDVVASLHPTPAVGGWPRAKAVDAIDRLEGMDRGWYAGPIGWLDLAGNGEFAVGLRSALVAGATARLYAGAGIVVGSEPPVEYAETETKLRPLREALGVVTGVE